MMRAPSIVRRLQVRTGAFSDYTVDFGSIQNAGGRLHFTDHSLRESRTIGLSVDDGAFFYRIQQTFPSVVADLIDLAVAINATDRLARQHLRRSQRRLHVVLPVRHPELMYRVHNRLRILLEWATGSQWDFDFRLRSESGRVVELEIPLLPCAPPVSEVALWSGGLDALAGLHSRLNSDPDARFGLLGTGNNDGTHARQQHMASELGRLFPGRLHLYRVPIRFHASGDEEKNAHARARGVVFTLVGAACAHLLGQRELCVYENGIGAINLHFRASSIGLDHSRSVHPLTLLMVSDLVSELLGEKFRVWNPFLFSTKGEMCTCLGGVRIRELVQETMSCDSPHRKQPIQCGYCSSCLLRRQALATAGVEDLGRYIASDSDHAPLDPALHFRALCVQVQRLQQIFAGPSQPEYQWEALTRQYPTLDDIVDRCFEPEGVTPDEFRLRLLRLYRVYASEWATVESRLASGLVN